MNFKRIEDLTTIEAREFLESFDNILFDFDGVICLIKSLIPGAECAINGIRAIGKSVRVVTNNTIYGLDDFKKLFQRLNVNVEKHEIINQTRTITQYLKSTNFQKEILLVCSPDSYDHYKSQFKIFEVPHKCTVTIEDIKEMLETVKSRKEIGAVLMDITFDITYAKLLQIQYILSRPDVLFLVGAYDNALPIAPNVNLISPTTFVDKLIEFTGRQPIIFGKPSEQLKEFLYKDLNIVDPKRTLFVGDSLVSDMQFATKCGFKKLLVFSGITKEESLNSCSEEQRPDYVASSLKALAVLLEKLHLNVKD